MDLIFWGALLACSGISFIIGVGIGGLLTVRRADAHYAAFLQGEPDKDAQP